MAENITIRRTTSHIRSTSLPSISHPLDSNIEVISSKIHEAGPTTSASSICHNLHDILNLYNNVNSSIQCPMNQQLLSVEQHRNEVENVLEESLCLIDSYESTKDVLSLLNDSILELCSSLRRKNGCEQKGVNAYMTSRKKIRKLANKVLKDLNKMNSKNNEGGGSNNITILTILGEVEAISLSILKSTLTYLSKSTINGKAWSLVAKLMHSKSVSYNGVEDDNEIHRIDQAICDLDAKNCSLYKKMVLVIVREIETLESSIQEIEGCLESICRCLLKTRVSLLNVVSSR